MKIDRVVFGWDGAPEFEGYLSWNARAYAKLGIKSAVVYTGNSPFVPPVGMDVISVGTPAGFGSKPPRNWVPTIGLLWAACQFPGETVLTSGLDQVPLSRQFLAAAAIIPADVFIGFAGARTTFDEHVRLFGCNYYPSSHLVARSDIFQRILKFSPSWPETLWTVSESKLPVMWPQIGEGWWGIDEAYFSRKLFEAEIARVVTSSESSPGWFEEWDRNRTGRGFPDYDRDKLWRGGYSELHGDRPISERDIRCVKDFLEAP